MPPELDAEVGGDCALVFLAMMIVVATMLELGLWGVH